MELIADILKEHGISYKISGKDLVVKCLNPEHDDSNPSCRIDRTTGATHCFSCGFKTNILKFFNVLADKQVFIKVARLKEKIKDLSISSKGLDLPTYYTPYTHSFRGISKETLKHFEAFYLSAENKDMLGFEDRIIFPLKDITDKIVAFMGRHTLSNGNPRYLNWPSKVTLPLVPSKLEERSNSIVLVEGIFDMLNCYDKGLRNTVALLGVNRDIRNDMLVFKAQGVDTVYIMFDGDDAGREGAKKMQPSLEAMGFIVEVIKLEDDTDPGELSDEYVRSIKEYIDGKSS